MCVERKQHILSTHFSINERSRATNVVIKCDVYSLSKTWNSLCTVSRNVYSFYIALSESISERYILYAYRVTSALLPSVFMYSNSRRNRNVE